MLRVNTLFKSVSYHPLEHQVVTTGTDRKIGFWETFDGSLIRELDGSLTDSVNAVDVSEDGVYIVSGGADKLVKVSFIVETASCFEISLISGAGRLIQSSTTADLSCKIDGVLKNHEHFIIVCQ